MCRRTHRRFVAAVPAARQARQFATATLAAAIDGTGSAVVDDAELVVGELVVNAIQADASSVDLQLEVHYDRIEIAVTDDGTGRPTLRVAASDDPSGRGLQIVAAVAADWGATVDADGRTVVWATMRCDPQYTTELACEYR